MALGWGGLGPAWLLAIFPTLALTYSISIHHFLPTVFLHLFPWAPLFKLGGRKSGLER